MRELKSVKKLTNEKFLNLYKATYLDDGKEHFYTFASRKTKDNLVVNNKTSADAVRVLPYYYVNNKIKIILIKEFRFAINDYIYGTPAGLIDEGEESEAAARREIREEIGAEIISMNKVLTNSFASAGLTDESLDVYEAEIQTKYEQNLDEFEDIEILPIDLNQIPNLISTHKFCLQSALHLLQFYYKHEKEN